ncbi:MAG: homocysteine S-methyltransferase family protein, partial [Chloroflexi bacterium]|nr:homocysteine S-methyltransferase family protein [Chloroflexota bacterium]
MKLFPHTNRRYLDAIADHVVVFDGSMGVTLLAKNLTADDYGRQQYFGCVDYLAISRPDIVEQIHSSFLAVGAEVLETDTFRANRITMKEYGLQDRVVEINREAAALARRVAERFTSDTGVPRFVAGAIGPSGLLPSSDDKTLGDITFAELREAFREQATGLMRGGADLIIIETQQDILETKAAIHGVWTAFEQLGVRIPIQAQVTLDTSGRMLLGTDIAAALTTLEAIPVVDVIGLNCSTGPDYMREPIRYLTTHARKPISCIPNAGLPLNIEGREVYPMQPMPIAEILAEFALELGVNVVGGCCGTTPDHIREVVQRVGGRKPKARVLRETSTVSDIDATSSNRADDDNALRRRLINA